MDHRLLVYCPVSHARIRYVFEWLRRFTGHREVIITQSSETYDRWEGHAVSYSENPVKKGIWIPYTSSIVNNRLPVEVHSPSFQAFLGTRRWEALQWDYPAAIFWWLSRQEEYDAQSYDEHGRFSGTSCLAYRLNALHKPIVDLLAALLPEQLQVTYPGWSPPPPEVHWLPTYDVDFAWQFAHRPLIKWALSTLGAIRREGLQAGKESFLVRAGTQKDPYDFYDEWFQQKAVLFFPLGDPGQYDRQHDWRHPAYQDVIRRFHAAGRAGIHPSYPASNNEGQLQREVDRYIHITGALPLRSRNHYLRFSFPETSRHLIQAGIKEDWTMGFADHAGFRAGTCHPFKWYDLEEEKETELTIHPLVAMDVTLNFYMKQTPDEAITYLSELRNAVQQTGGEWITLWHHAAYAARSKQWKGWKTVLESLK